MQYALKAYLIHDIGQCEKQEDACFPPMTLKCHYDGVERQEAYYEGVPHTEDSLFLLCDGMGGHERGEVASRTVCDVMSSSVIDAEAKMGFFDSNMVLNAVDEAYNALDALDDPGEERKMGTTMTLLKLHRNGATIAHIGDSRVYHCRLPYGKKRAEILFRTEDHSLVNMLLKNGTLSFQQAEHFPQRHVLVKAMQAGQSERVVPDIYHTSDVMPGDVFCLCSDGMLEGLYDEDLCAMLTNPNYTDERRVQILLNFCKDNQDNHTAWIVRVVAVMTDDGHPVEYDKEERIPDSGFIGRLIGKFSDSKR